MLERTMFYGRELLGQGTGQVQSMRSYFEHLALAHNMRPRALLEWLLRHHPSDKVDMANAGGLMNAKLHINSDLAEELRIRLEMATGTNLAQGTLGTLAKLLAPIGLSRKPKDFAYCPRCLLEDEGVPYMRLLWDVECVRACPLHAVKLRSVRASSCTADASQLLVLNQRPCLGGACTSCGSLGYKCASEPIEPAAREDVWVAEQVARLLELPEETRNAFSHESLRKGLLMLVDQRFEGSVVRTSNAAGLSKSTVSTWVKGARFGLPSLLQLCLHTGADVVALMGGRFVPSSTPPEPTSSYKVRYRAYSRARTPPDAVQQLLLAAAVEAHPPSLWEFGRKHGVHHDQVRHQFPEEVKKLSSARQAYLAKQRAQKAESTLTAFRHAVESLVARGVAVHSRTLQKEARLMAINRGGYRYAALQTVLQESRGAQCA